MNLTKQEKEYLIKHLRSEYYFFGAFKHKGIERDKRLIKEIIKKLKV